VSILAVFAAHGRHCRLNRLQLLVKVSRLEAADHDATAMAAELDTLRAQCKELEQQIDDAGIQMSGMREDLKAAVAEVKRLQQKVIRSAAEQERLRQAVINARPRITYTVQALDRPYVSHVQVPYPVPVGNSSANETTQEIALVDLPGQRSPAA
jgi:septal ring factor EnvC (AmiA/AmiB activator)